MSESLFMKYRPTGWNQLIGHSKLKASIKRMQGGLGGRAFLISGPSGIGKSTAAYLIAQDICDPENIIEVNATVVTPKMVQEWDRKQAQLLIGEKPGRAIIVNEVHKMRTDVVTLMLEILEHVRSNCVWIFTTQGKTQMGLFDDEDSGALESRCVKYKLEAKPCRLAFARWGKAVAEKEGLGGCGLDDYLTAIDDCDLNLRELLSRVEAGEFLPDEEVSILEQLESLGG